jgi:hypothetical protein
MFLKKKILIHASEVSQSQQIDKEFLINSQNLAMTDDSLRFLHRFKDFSRGGAPEDFRNQNSTRASPRGTSNLKSNQ